MKEGQKLVHNWESLKAFMLAKHGVYDDEKCRWIRWML
jgi:hypothetical protein